MIAVMKIAVKIVMPSTMIENSKGGICIEGNGEFPFQTCWVSLCFFFFSFIFISWRLITLQHRSGFCHTLK